MNRPQNLARIVTAFAHDLEVGDVGSRLPQHAARQSVVHRDDAIISPMHDKVNTATRTIASTLGVLVGVGSNNHGILEMPARISTDAGPARVCTGLRISLDGLETRR